MSEEEIISRQAYLNGKARRLIYSMLEQHLSVNDEGTYTYTNGWSDLAITLCIRESHPKAEVKVGMITGVRNRGWGTLYKEVKQTDKERIAELEAKVEKLEASKNAPMTTEELFEAPGDWSKYE